MTYDPARTALLLVDPYNDFLSEGGKVWPRVRDVAEAVDTLANLRTLTSLCRELGVRIVYVPHRRWEPGDYEDWDHATPYQLAGAKRQPFARGTWGGTFHADLQPQAGDVVAHEHWGSSGFANTDLDMQLKQHGVRRVIVVGMIAHTCLDATGRFAMELGYHVTLVKDATADFSDEMMHAAHEITGPTFAHAIVTTATLVAQLRRAGAAAA